MLLPGGAAAFSAAFSKSAGKMLLRSCTKANSELLGRVRLGEVAWGVAGNAASNLSKDVPSVGAGKNKLFLDLLPSLAAGTKYKPLAP